MRPVKLPSESTLRPIHYLVDVENARLQAYEYEYADDDSPLPDLTPFEPFLVEFCHTVAHLGLQRKFGLKITDASKADGANRTEYEFPQKRSTITIPEGLPAPEDDDVESYSVITEWSPGQSAANACRHGCRHSIGYCRHPRPPPNPNSHSAAPGDDHFTLGGRVLVPGSPVHDLVAAVVEAW
jgi:hypothetical protein